MKTIGLNLLVACFCLSSCKKEQADIENPLIGTWNLIQISGGLAGTVENIPKGEVVWTFEPEQLTKVDNLTSTAETVPYSLLTDSNELFISINGSTYFSNIRITGDQMEIDPSSSRTIIQNDTIEVAIADGFVHLFEK